MITIIIPTFNRCNDLIRCLNLILKQKDDAQIEIIVIDDGSTDKTAETTKDYVMRYKQLKYFRQENKGPATARNLGIDNAKGDIIAFIDDDCIPEKDWIKKIVNTHKKHKQLVVGGLTKVDNNHVSTFVTQYLTNQALVQEINGVKKFIYFPTCNVSFKKAVFDRFKFDETFPLPGGEDLEFGWRLLTNNVEMIQDKEIVVYHNINPSLKSFIKKAYFYGQGNLMVKKIFPDHVLLKNLNINNNFSFLTFNIRNFLKTPLFGLTWASKIRRNNKSNINFLKLTSYFALHNLAYAIGNFKEYWKKSKTTIPAKPTFLIIDCTHKCNLRCKMCDIVKDTKKELTTKESLKIIKEGIDWDVENIVLSGGEPLIRKDIFEILKFVRKNNNHVGILTNGTFNEQIFEKLKPYLINNSLSLIISIDGAKPETHDLIRGKKGLHKKTLNTLNRLKKLKEKHPTINYGIITIIMNENLEELELLVEMLKKLDVNSIQFQPLLSNNLSMYKREESKFWIPKKRLKDLDETIEQIKRLKQKHPKLITNSLLELELVKKYFRNKLTPKDVKCYAATKTMLISNDGNITACKTSYGNIRQKLKNVWNSKQAEKARILVKECKEPCLLPCFIETVKK